MSDMEVTAGLVLAAIAVAIIAALALWLAMRKALFDCRSEAKLFESKCHELEKELHRKERDFLAERNQLESNHFDRVRAAREGLMPKARKMVVLRRIWSIFQKYHACKLNSPIS
ncbi:MAG: hypothetical protein IPJ33_22420 [Gammaproteobacteria bacterium]|nr:hypothetical protein [Gammaproteobacteria bacterium]